MRIYNFVKFGMFIGFLGIITDAYADTVIASKAYVDSKVADVATDALNNFTTTGTGTVIKSIAESDGTITATKGYIVSADITNGTIVADDLASNAVTTAKITDLNVTTGKLAAGAVTNAKLAADAVQTGNIANGTIIDEDISSSAAIAYTKMNGALSSVNVGSGDYSSSCTEGAPCVLTLYVKSGTKYYRWTNMNPEGLTAL